MASGDTKYFRAHSIGKHSVPQASRKARSRRPRASARRPRPAKASATNQPLPSALTPMISVSSGGMFVSTKSLILGTTFDISHSSGSV